MTKLVISFEFESNQTTEVLAVTQFVESLQNSRASGVPVVRQNDAQADPFEVSMSGAAGAAGAAGTAEKVPAKRGRKPKEQPPQPPQPLQPPRDDPTAVSINPTFTLDVLRAKARELAELPGGDTKLLELLTSYKITRISMLNPKDYEAFYRGTLDILARVSDDAVDPVNLLD